MTLHLSLDNDSRVYYTLTCTQCSARFRCFDDACYSFATLRVEAVFAGWDAAARPEQPHYCPRCVRRRNRRNTQTESDRPQQARSS